MRNFTTKSFMGLACSASTLAILTALPTTVSAQVADDDGEQVCELDAAGNPTGISVNDPNCETTDIAPEADGSVQPTQVVITGSRIQRDDTYSSISPLQVLETQTLQDTGQFDAASILQQSESAAGTQIDATFQGFVLNNGPGSQTLNLRGLGAERTLLLINGRRLAPSGVEGAPTSPSINLIPSSLVARYDLLLDGASSVYGSDAVAGVGNVVLRKDIDGVELFASGQLNEYGDDKDFTVSGAFGKFGDNWNFGIGAEYSRRDVVRYGDREFLAGCDTNYEIDQDGNILTVGLADNAAVQNRTPGVSVSESPCKIGGISGRIFNPFTRFGSIYFAGNGNIGNIPGLPNFGESTDAFGVNLDSNNDGVRDVDFQNVNTNSPMPNIVFVSPQDLYNVMAYGEYTFGGDANITPFFEALYSRADVEVDDSGAAQLFPYVPDLNIFNPCNFRTNPDGADCRAADNALQQINPGQARFGRAGRLSTGFATPVLPIAAIRGDRDNVSSTVEQYRGVVGVRGDMPFLDFGPGNDWTFEVAGVYSRSEGSSLRRGVREDKLALALGLDPTADYNEDGVVDNDGDGIADDYDADVAVFGAFGDPQFIGECNVAGLANPSLAAPDLADGCVPVNLFAPSVLTGAVGSFASQAEADYVFGDRAIDTTYQQTVISGFIQGSVFDLPGGTAKAVLGLEYRDDTIQTTPNSVASNGLLFGFFRDLGTNGSNDVFEAFGELDLPLVSGETLAEAVRLNISGRLTQDQLYGTNGTYAIKLGWQPFEPLLLKLSYGTSFRAPNLRELYLGGLSGFTGVFDPCSVPQAAFSSATGFDPALDTREAEVLEICRREGRDPTRVGIDQQGLNVINSSSVEVLVRGDQVTDQPVGLQPETSDAFTTGLAFAEQFGPVDFSFNFNYYNIAIKNAVTQLSAGFTVNECFSGDPSVRSVFCDRIDFGTTPTSRFLINDVDIGFLNFDQEKVEGIDLNANIGTDLRAFGEDVALGLNLRANHLISRSSLFLLPDGTADFDEDAGEFGFPSWTGRATFTAQVDRFTFTWQTRYIGRTEQEDQFIDPLSDAFGFGPDGEATGFIGDTCLGSGSRTGGVLNGRVEGDGVFCRDVGFADAYTTSSASIRVNFDQFDVRLGVSNIFDAAPPRIDTNEVFGLVNTPIGNGYDLSGREYFGSVSFRF